MDYDDWFSQTFNIDTSGNTDYGTGGDPGNYSGADYDAMFAKTFGSGDGSPTGMLATSETSQGAPAGAASASYTGGSGDWTSGGALDTIKSWGEDILGAIGKAAGAAGKLFTEPEGSTMKLNPATGKYEPVATGGGLSSLGQLLLAGAVQSLGQGSVLKWQAERASKEKAKDRAAVLAAQNEKYRRQAYGAAPQLGAPQRGIGLVGTAGGQ